MNLQQLITAIADDQLDDAIQIIQSGVDLNTKNDQGVPALYFAILDGNPSMVQLLIGAGADPNFVATEPAATIYHEKPLLLAMAARNLMDWDKYQPVVKLLETFGATDTDGQIESATALLDRERQAREFQQVPNTSAH